jgi:hypothetical protein
MDGTEAVPPEEGAACAAIPVGYARGMLSERKLEAYRRMTPGDRWREVEELMTLAWRSLLELPEEERQRRLEIIREEHEASDRIILERLRRLQ